MHKGPSINYVVKNRDFLTVCLSLLTTLLSENRQKSWFFDGLSVSFDDVVYEWSLSGKRLHVEAIIHQVPTYPQQLTPQYFTTMANLKLMIFLVRTRHFSDTIIFLTRFGLVNSPFLFLALVLYLQLFLTEMTTKGLRPLARQFDNKIKILISVQNYLTIGMLLNGLTPFLALHKIFAQVYVSPIVYKRAKMRPSTPKTLPECTQAYGYSYT